jgi:glucokinase
VAAGAASTYLAIDVGVDRLAAGVVNDRGEVLVRDRVATPQRDVWPGLQRLVKRVVAALEARLGDSAALLACGVACEGPIDLVTGTVEPLHIPLLRGFEMRDRISELTQLPTVLASASQARVMAERWIGAARGAADVMVLLLGDAVEAGVVSRGRLLTGRRGNAGQIGHLPVEPNGAQCVCGARGCLWAYVSGGALGADPNRPLQRAPAAVIERSGLMAGRAIATAVAVLDLQLVLLAGSVPAAFGQPFFDAVWREFGQRSGLARSRSGAGQGPQVEIGMAALGREAALVGAAGLSRLWLLQSAGADAPAGGVA